MIYTSEQMLNSMVNRLHIAALEGDLNLCKVLIDKHNFDLNLCDKHGWTALHLSAQSGNYELVTYFADMETDIQLKANGGKNCLHIAALKEHLNLCKVLIKNHKFDVNLADKRGWTALHFSVQIGNYELVTYFADMGTDIHLKTNDGFNCLHIAAEQGHLYLSKRLIGNHKFDLDMTDNYGWAALHYSSKNSSYKLFTYLADMGCDIHLKTNDGKNHLSTKSGNYELFIHFADMGTHIHLKTID